jgi:hypothetical protein
MVLGIIELDVNLIDYDQLITELELYLVKHAKVDDAFSLHLRRSVPGIGKILALLLLDEIHTIERFASAETSNDLPGPPQRLVRRGLYSLA